MKGDYYDEAQNNLCIGRIFLYNGPYSSNAAPDAQLKSNSKTP